MLKIAKAVGVNSDQEAALALVRKASSAVRSDGNIASEEGLDFFAVVKASLDDAFTKTRSSLAEAESTFFSSSSPISERLHETLQSIRSALPEAASLSIMLASCKPSQSGKSLYLLCFGEEVSAYLKNLQSFVELFDRENRGTEPVLISGFLKPGDRIVLITNHLSGSLGSSFKMLFDCPVNIWEEEILNALPKDDLLPSAAIVLEEEEDQAEDIQLLHQEKTSAQSLIREGIFLKVVSGRGVVLPLIKKIMVPPIKLLLRSKKVLAVLSLVIAVGVISALFLINKSHQSAKQQQRYQEVLGKAQSEYQKAREKGTGPEALSSLSLAKEALEEAIKINPSDEAVLALKKQIEDGEGEILKVYKISELPLWLDLSLIKKDFAAREISLSLGNILILDTNSNSLVVIDLSNKSPQIVSGGDKIGQASLSSLNGEQAFVYSEKGIIKVDISSKEEEVVIKVDPDWGKISSIEGYAGNVYLLDQQQIYKYLPIESGYSDKRNYLKEGITVDFGNAKKMVIDSSIYALKEDGEVLKFTQGAADYFSFSGLDKPLNGVKSIFASDKTENFYLLDSGNNRLIVTDKKGSYLAQYQGSQFGSLIDLVVDEDNKKIYLLDGGRIYWMELR